MTPSAATLALMKGTAEKDVLSCILPDMFKKLDVVTYVFVTEAWVLENADFRLAAAQPNMRVDKNVDAVW